MTFEEFGKKACGVPYRLDTTKYGCSLFHIKSTYFITVFRHFLAYQIFRDLYFHEELYRYYRKTKRKRGVSFYVTKLQFVKCIPLILLLSASFNVSFRDTEFLRRHFYLACGRDMPISIECYTYILKRGRVKVNTLLLRKRTRKRKKISTIYIGLLVTRPAEAYILFGSYQPTWTIIMRAHACLNTYNYYMI